MNIDLIVRHIPVPLIPPTQVKLQTFKGFYYHLDDF